MVAFDGFDSHGSDCRSCVDYSLGSGSWVAEAVNKSASAASSNLTVPTQQIILAKIQVGDLVEAVGLDHEMHSLLVDVEEAEVKTSYCFDGVRWNEIGEEAPEYRVPLGPSRDLRLASRFVGNYSNVSVALHRIDKQNGCYLGHSFDPLYSLSAFVIQKAFAGMRFHRLKWQDMGSPYLGKVLPETIES